MLACEWLDATVAITSLLLVISNAIVAVSFTRTIRSMRAARSDMQTARRTYDVALRELGYERRTHST